MELEHLDMPASEAPAAPDPAPAAPEAPAAPAPSQPAQAPAAAQAPPPDFEKDPKGYVDSLGSKFESALSELKKTSETLTQTADAATRQAQQVQFTQQLGTVEAAFVAQTPDYHEALAHVRNIRAQQLAMIYPQAKPEQIAQAIGQEELTAAFQLTQQGRNPAEFAYQYAKTLGYTKKAPTPTPPAAAAPAAAPAIEQLSPAATLGTGGGAPGTSADEVQGDGYEAFDRAFADVFGSRKRA